nr:hypothetical protein [Tanacetum cinerariifolium]
SLVFRGNLLKMRKLVVKKKEMNPMMIVMTEVIKILKKLLNLELEETAKNDEELKETGTGGNEVRKSGGESEEEKETSEEEEVSFDPIPRTPEDSEKESDDEEEQESRLSEEARLQEEEDAEELYRDVNINQGRGLQVTQSVQDTHVILTPVNPNDPQESSSMSSFVSSML